MHTPRASDLHLAALLPHPASCCCAMLPLPTNTRRTRSGRLYEWRLFSCKSSSHEPQSRLAPGHARVLVRPLSACLRQSDGVSPPPNIKWARVWASRPRRCGKGPAFPRSPSATQKQSQPHNWALAWVISVPHRLMKHSYYVNWDIGQRHICHHPGHNTGSRANARPSMPSQSSPRSRGFCKVLFIVPTLFCKDGEGENKRKAREQQPRVCLSACLPGSSISISIYYPPVRLPLDARLDAIQIYLLCLALGYLAVSRTLH